MLYVNVKMNLLKKFNKSERILVKNAFQYIYYLQVAKNGLGYQKAFGSLFLNFRLIAKVKILKCQLILIFIEHKNDIRIFFKNLIVFHNIYTGELSKTSFYYREIKRSKYLNKLFLKYINSVNWKGNISSARLIFNIFSETKLANCQKQDQNPSLEKS